MGHARRGGGRRRRRPGGRSIPWTRIVRAVSPAGRGWRVRRVFWLMRSGFRMVISGGVGPRSSGTLGVVVGTINQCSGSIQKGG